MLKFKKISKKYGDFLALDEISFSVKKGEITALLGPNGAGKTTSMKILTGFLEPSQGIVEIDEEILDHKSKKYIQEKIGYLPENAPLYPELSVWDHLDLAAKIHNIPKSKRNKAIQKTAKICGLNEKLYFDVSELSKGYKQRVGLAQAIIHDPTILILDEPTTGLDPNQIQEIRDLILSWKGNKTILLSTHIMQEVEAVADNVIIINAGKVIKETTKAKLKLKNDSEENETFTIKIEYQGTKAKLNKFLTQLKKDKTILDIQADKNQLTIQSSQDSRSKLAENLIKSGLDLLHLSLETTSMEEIFRNLTQKN